MLVVEAVKVVGDPDRVDRDPVRRPPLRGLRGGDRKISQPLDQIPLFTLELGGWFRADLRAAGIPQDPRDPRMRVLDVVDGIFLRALGGEVDVDVDRLIVPPRDEIPARSLDPDRFKILKKPVTAAPAGLSSSL